MPEKQAEGARRQPSERTFTEDVIETAHLHGWQPFHLRDRDSIHIVRGRGFPRPGNVPEGPRDGEHGIGGGRVEAGL